MLTTLLGDWTLATVLAAVVGYRLMLEMKAVDASRDFSASPWFLAITLFVLTYGSCQRLTTSVLVTLVLLAVFTRHLDTLLTSFAAAVPR